MYPNEKIPRAIDPLPISVNEEKAVSSVSKDLEKKSVEQAEKKNVLTADDSSVARRTDGANAKRIADRAEDERVPNVQNTVSPAKAQPDAKHPQKSESDGLHIDDSGRAKTARSTNATAWQMSATRFGVQYRSDKNVLLDHGSRIMGATGSAQEVAGMLELAQKKGWNPLDFNGSEKFKAEVIKAALEKGLTVTTRSEQDAKLYAKLKTEFDAQNQAVKKDAPELESPATKETELVRKDRDRGDAHSRTGAPSEKNGSSSPQESPKDYARATKVLAELKFELKSCKPDTAEHVEVLKHDTTLNRDRKMQRP